jgi:four helix bundle protein
MSGANYVEADDADSKKDFKFKTGLCRREAKETKHWLRMIAAAAEEYRDDARPLWREVQEINLIFSAIRRKL